MTCSLPLLCQKLQALSELLLRFEGWASFNCLKRIYFTYHGSWILCNWYMSPKPWKYKCWLLVIKLMRYNFLSVSHGIVSTPSLPRACVNSAWTNRLLKCPPLTFALRKAPAVKKLTLKSLTALSTKTSHDGWVFLEEDSFYRAPSPPSEGFIRIPLFPPEGLSRFPAGAAASLACTSMPQLQLLYTPQQQKQPLPPAVCDVCYVLSACFCYQSWELGKDAQVILVTCWVLLVSKVWPLSYN